jgi:RimJ/RimL family protein N-acetyltransferase
MGGIQDLETKRLYLRCFRPEDLDDLARLLGDPEIVRYMGKDGKPISRDESEVALSSMIRHWERHGFGRWAAIHKEESRLIGYGGIRSLDGEAELVYLLDKPYWGMGLATEIARACLRYGFEEKRFLRILALAKPANLASRRVMEKVGMHYEKRTDYFGIDVVEYSISKGEYHGDDSIYLLHSAE